MSQLFKVEQLPDIDQREIKRGRCPWCLVKMVPVDMNDAKTGDQCPECGDRFVGTLNFED